MAIVKPQDILVGIDPVQDFAPALAWATDEARRRVRGLRLVVAVPPEHDTQHVDDAPRYMAQRLEAARLLRTAVEWVAEREPEVRAGSAVLDGFPAGVLVGLSKGADMAVLGSRRLGRFAEFLSAGSVALPVTARAHCPVVVVPARETREEDLAEPEGAPVPHLVAGVDGSESARVALGLAFEEAALRGCELRVVAVWQRPVFSPRTRESGFRSEFRMLGEVTDSWARKYPEVRIVREVLAGSPVEVLADVAEDASALLVGRRGSGGYGGMRMGSVTYGLLHRARCPVITVPPTPASTRDAPTTRSGTGSD
ncbi:universal stress protein [Streptomyces physcomitrii]|uniref:Universal stress protein family n=1 Tax=Streptomyces albus (strain ATCC 21838 / DSM 41398 / FERM P-419 / JCM 4703 / NBRC 107858) TaxID=1081613 RepID=A0A0B5EZW1_STRA4|nr:universal stress protein family [Streptomyces albus]AOU77924.1 universal stress protein family [Streptomyces albus]AYN33679.1 universal stress protein [Streptomyces albus]